jgi:hypothetical protein
MAEGHKISDLFNSIEEVKTRMSSYEVVILEDEEGNKIKMDRQEYDRKQDRKTDEILRILTEWQEVKIKNGEGPKKWQRSQFDQWLYDELKKINNKFSFKYVWKIVGIFLGGVVLLLQGIDLLMGLFKK